MAVRLHGAQKEVLELELAALAERAPTDAGRQRYLDLAAQAATGQVAEEQLGLLEGVLEVLVQSGRARKLYGPGGEQALAQLFGRTPRGAAVAETVTSLNRALESLAGQSLQKLAVSAHGPGAYKIQIDTDQGRLSLRLDGQGARLESLEVGL
jgi:hypothetical protein